MRILAKRILLSLSLFFYCSSINARTITDSLFHQLSISNSSQDSCENLLKLSQNYLYVSIDSSMMFAYQAKEIAHRLNDESQVAYAQLKIGRTCIVKGDNDAAIKNLTKARTYFEKVGDDQGLSFTYEALGIVYYSFSSSDSVYFFMNKSIDLIMEQEEIDWITCSNIHLNLGAFYFEQKDLEKATKHYLAGRENAQKASYQPLYDYSSLLLITVEKEKGNIELAQKQFRELYFDTNRLQSEDFEPELLAKFEAELATELANSFIETETVDSIIHYGIIALEKSKEIGLVLDVAELSLIISNAYISKKNLSRAKKYLAISESQNLGTQEKQDLFQDVNTLLLKGKILWFEGEKQKGLGNIQKAESIAKKNKLLSHLEDLYLDISKFSEDNGDYKNALKYQKKYEILHDSLLTAESIKQVNELEIAYHTKEKDAQLNLQSLQIERSQTINIFFGIFLFSLVGFLGYVLYNSRQKKRTNDLLRQQAKELKRLDHTKSRFFANISHELRTPLTLILAPIENALEKTKNLGLRKDLEVAHSNSKNLLSLVNEILDLGKLESGKMSLKEDSVNLQILLRRIIFSFHSLANIRGFMLGFHYHLPEDLWIKLDISKFEKILNNLISNAFKYSNHGGVITLRVNQLDEDTIQFEVEDQGKGIGEKELKKIFDRFYQVEEGEDEPLRGGTGIGLALAKELAEAFQGTLKVRSELGKGTTFIFTMPLKKAEPLKETAVDKIMAKTDKIQHSIPLGPLYTPVVLNGEKPNILIVEDNPEMSTFLERILSPYYKCKITQDGQKALEELEENTYDLITSDVMMPNMDGFTFVEKVHEKEKSSQLPVVMLTARSLEEDKLRGLSLGVDDYITKPFSSQELLVRIDNLLKNKQKRDEWQKEQEPKVTDSELSAEKDLLSKAENFVLSNLSNSAYRVDDLAADMAYSSRQLIRVIKKLTGLTPNGFIREIRLQKAYQFLQERRFFTVAEVRYETGFENASYFTKIFTKRFGKRPGDIFQ